jgi:hypothetical protein
MTSNGERGSVNGFLYEARISTQARHWHTCIENRSNCNKPAYSLMQRGHVELPTVFMCRHLSLVLNSAATSTVSHTLTHGSQ